MPIYNEGTCKCSYCNKEFRWDDQKIEASRMSSGKMKFEPISQAAHAEIFFDSDNRKMIIVRCKFCNRTNIFPAENQ